MKSRETPNVSIHPTHRVKTITKVRIFGLGGEDIICAGNGDDEVL